MDRIFDHFFNDFPGRPPRDPFDRHDRRDDDAPRHSFDDFEMIDNEFNLAMYNFGHLFEVFDNFGRQFGHRDLPLDYYSDRPMITDGNESDNQGKSIRDQMLKSHSERQNRIGPEDYDYDDEIASGGIDVIRDQLQPKRNPFFKSFSSFSSYSGTFGNGKVEEHRIVRDSQGNEEQIVTQRIGDKAISRKMKKNANGEVEQVEDLVNLDENDLKDFEQKWNSWSGRSNPGNHLPTEVIKRPDIEPSKKEKPSWLKRITNYFSS